MTQSAVVVAVVAGGVGVANVNKSVNLSVDGKASAVNLFGSTVGDVLTHQGIKLSSHDLVAPAVSTPLEDNQKVVVRYGRLLTVTVDGKTKEFWTTSTSVSGALSELGIRASSAKLSVSRSQPLGRLGLAMSVTTPKNVSVSVDGKTLKVQTTSPTVAGALAQLKVKVGARDRVVPALKTPVAASGLKVSVARVKLKGVSSVQSIRFGTSRRADADLYKGTTKTLKEGKQGRRVVSTVQTWVNGKLESSKVRSSRVANAPVAHVVAIGTKSRPVKAAPAPAALSAPSSSGGGSTVNSGMWDRIAKCESGNNWSTNTGNGYYGGLQFDNQTWLGAGGGQFAPRADLASREQQIAIANKVYADRGLQPWQCGWAA
jgi:uncharacterized protein YabE (DUF348 family)